MIVITGATGQLGGAIVRSLLQRAPGARIAASVRNPEQAGALAQLGVEVRRGDFSRPETLVAAFSGATQVLVVSSNAGAFGADPVAQHRAAIDAAKQAGAQRILYTSHVAASAWSSFSPMHTHAATERILAESGVRWTSLRNGFYAASALVFIGDGLEKGRIAVPDDGKVVWTTHADLADAAAAVVLDEGCDGPIPLTGGEGLDMADIARIASEVLGRNIERESISDAALEERLKALGVPPPRADILLGFYRASRAGEFARVDGTLEKLIGRKPQSMRSVLERLPA
ncbi:MAG TPA: SDR family oxidoreductase [Polyangiaceae bacterium]|nr:SDR family oxidoreductase [Polyangiaceae bacterium]